MIAMLPSLLFLVFAATPGARVMVGKQKAHYRVTPRDMAMTVPDYRNNGFRQRVSRENDQMRVDIEVGNQRLGSRMRGRVASGFPKELGELERRLNEAASGYFADQVAIMMDWLRAEVAYNQSSGGDQRIHAVLASGRANCVGYCNLAIFILEKMGVEARYVTGVAFRQDDPANRLLEGDVLHRWIEIKYDDVGWVFSDPAGKVNFVEATYLVLGVQNVHPLEATLEKAVGAGIRLMRLRDGLRRVGTLKSLDQRLRIRPNQLTRF